MAWTPTQPHVVPEQGGGRDVAERPAYTTIANWSGYGGVEHEGAWYGQKDERFEALLDLPSHAPVPLEVALSGAGDAVLDRFRAHGWSAFDGKSVSLDVDTYLDYVASSRGELSPAKHAYVVTRSGWVSDRTVGYLAAGRPVVVEDTGVIGLPAGEGFTTFVTADEALDRLDAVESDPERHRAAARSLAHDVLSYRHVLPRLLDVALDTAVAGRRTAP
jgi:hypothetical protein